MLTPAQRVIVFEILDVTMSDNLGLMVDMDHMATFAINYGDSAKRTSLFIDARLNHIATNNPELEERLLCFIKDWTDIGTDPSHQDGGTIGSLTSITDDPTAELKIIRGRVETIIGIREWNEKRTTTRDVSVKFVGAIAG